MAQDAGDWRVPTLVVAPFDSGTSASIEVEDPTGNIVTQVPTSVDNVPEVGQQTWTGAGYELTVSGEWIERWTVAGTGASKERSVIRVAPDPAAKLAGVRIYATTTDYADYLLDAPPAGARRSLAAASRRIDELILTACYDVDDDGLPTDADISAALTLATCAQAAHMREIGDPYGTGASQYAEVQIATVRLVRTNQPPAGMPSRYSAEAFAVLQQAGLTGAAPISGTI